MRNLILTAGKASRLGELAPYGCKAMTRFRGKPIIQWQLDVLGEATIVCRREHVDVLKRFGPCIPDDTLRGPAHALYVGLTNEPTTVVFADSFFEELPAGAEWCATATATGKRVEAVFEGGMMTGGDRSWDVVHPETRYSPPLIQYGVIAPGKSAEVCTGMYRFDDPFRLLRILSELPEGGMAYALNKYRAPFIHCDSWRDVGDPEALEAAT